MRRLAVVAAVGDAHRDVVHLLRATGRGSGRGSPCGCPCARSARPGRTGRPGSPAGASRPAPASPRCRLLLVADRDLLALEDARHQVGDGDHVDAVDGDQAAQAGALGLVADEVVGAQVGQAVGQRASRRGPAPSCRTRRRAACRWPRPRRQHERLGFGPGRRGDVLGDFQLDQLGELVDRLRDAVQRQRLVLLACRGRSRCTSPWLIFSLNSPPSPTCSTSTLMSLPAAPGFWRRQQQRAGGDLRPGVGSALRPGRRRAARLARQGLHVVGVGDADDVGPPAAVVVVAA